MILVDAVRKRMAAAVARPFGHAPYPLAETLRYEGDPGLFGPGSVSWKVVGDVSSMLGGIRALLIQAAHPEVVAGVVDHSRYREDPLGRLSRTSAYVTATTFGAMPEVEEAVERVRRAHRPVEGTSHRGAPYSAEVPRLSAWVHNALTDSFLAAYQVFGPETLTTREADRFVAEQARVGRLLDADPLPESAAELAHWIAHHERISGSPGMREAVEFLTAPPLEGRSLRAGYRILQAGAVATLPPRLRRILCVRTGPGAIEAARGVVASVRWAMGSSPSWHLALLRSRAPVPEGIFRQPLPEGSVGQPDTRPRSIHPRLVAFRTMGDDEYIRMRGTVKEVLRDATFKVEIEGGLEVMARPSGRMRRGRIIRILPGDQVDVEVSTYDPTKGRIVWRYR